MVILGQTVLQIAIRLVHFVKNDDDNDNDDAGLQRWERPIIGTVVAPMSYQSRSRTAGGLFFIRQVATEGGHNMLDERIATSCLRFKQCHNQVNGKTNYS